MTVLCAFNNDGYCMAYLEVSCDWIDVEHFIETQVRRQYVVEAFVLYDNFWPLAKSNKLLACIQDEIIGNCTLTKGT